MAAPSLSLIKDFHKIENKDITVYDCDVSAFVVLSKCHRSSLRRGHNPYCAAGVGAFQVGRGTQLRGLDGQILRQSEGLPRAVSAV